MRRETREDISNFMAHRSSPICVMGPVGCGLVGRSAGRSAMMDAEPSRAEPSQALVARLIERHLCLPWTRFEEDGLKTARCTEVGRGVPADQSIRPPPPPLQARGCISAPPWSNVPAPPCAAPNPQRKGQFYAAQLYVPVPQRGGKCPDFFCIFFCSLAFYHAVPFSALWMSAHP